MKVNINYSIKGPTSSVRTLVPQRVLKCTILENTSFLISTDHDLSDWFKYTSGYYKGIIATLYHKNKQFSFNLTLIFICSFVRPQDRAWGGGGFLARLSF